jgi:hypothetical protein
MNSIITNTANTYVVTWPTEEIVELELDVDIELNQLEELEELDDPEKNPLFEDLVAPVTVLRKGLNAFETYSTAAAISLLLLLHSIHEISNAPNSRQNHASRKESLYKGTVIHFVHILLCPYR